MRKKEGDFRELKQFSQRATDDGRIIQYFYFSIFSQLNSKQFEYMVKACPQTDFFVQWRTMLTFINTEYDVTMCDIVVESVRMLTQNIADNDVAANQRKLNEIVEWLPYFLRRIEPYHALVGRLLFTYVYIDNAEYAVDPVSALNSVRFQKLPKLNIVFSLVETHKDVGSNHLPQS